MEDTECRCELCNLTPALSVCCCRSPPLPLCSSCLLQHSTAHHFDIHTLFPISALRSLQLPGYLLRLQHRKHKTSQAIDELQDNLKQILYCQSLFSHKIHLMLESIQLYHDQTILLLTKYHKSLQKAIKNAINEANEHIFDFEYCTENPITKGLLEFVPGKLRIFSFEIMENGRLLYEFSLPKAIFMDSDTEIDDFDPIKPEITVTNPEKTVILPVIKEKIPPLIYENTEEIDLSPDEMEGPSNLPSPTFISDVQYGKKAENGEKMEGKVEEMKVPMSITRSNRVFASDAGACLPVSGIQLVGSSWTPLLFKITHEKVTILGLSSVPTQRDLLYSPVPLNRHSSLCVLNQDSLLLCGGDDPVNHSAYTLNFNTGKLTELRHMNQPRYAHGIAVYGACVYIFGGNNDIGIISSSERYRRKVKDWESLPSMPTPRSFFNPCVVGQQIYLLGGADTAKCEAFDIVGMRYSDLKITLPVPGATAAVMVNEDLIVLQTGKVGRIKANLKGNLQVYEVVNGDRSLWGNGSPVVLGTDILIGQCFSEQVLKVNSLSWSVQIYR